MSCFTGCFSKPQRAENFVVSKSTSLPMNFAPHEIEELNKKYTYFHKGL